MGALHLTDETFESEVLKYDGVVLVDFWAQWCGPCKMIAPIIDELASDLEGKAKVVKVDVDKAQSLAMQYGVMSIPTLIIFKSGEIVDQMVGAMGKDQLLEKVSEYL